MHMNIVVIVYAKKMARAKMNAQKVLRKMSGDDKPFDYFLMHDAAPVRALSATGRQLIRDYSAIQRRDWIAYLKNLKKLAADYSATELYEEQARKNKRRRDKAYDGRFRFFCHQLGQYEGSMIRFYDYQGSGMQTPRSLKAALDKYRCCRPDDDDPEKDPTRAGDVWLVCANVHY